MTEWKTKDWVREEEEKLRRQKASDNILKGRYVEIYREDGEGVYCQIRNQGPGHTLGMFEVKLIDWIGLKKTFLDAGYQIRRPQTTK